MSDPMKFLLALSIVLVCLALCACVVWAIVVDERSHCEAMREKLGQDPAYNLTQDELYALFDTAPADPQCFSHCCYRVMEQHVRSQALMWQATPSEGRLQAIKCRLSPAEHVLAYQALRDELLLGRTLPCETLHKTLPYRTRQGQ